MKKFWFLALSATVISMGWKAAAQGGLRDRLRERQERLANTPAALRSSVPGTVQKSVPVDGKTRTFLVHAPVGYDPVIDPRPLPLVLCFHGGGGFGKQQEQTTQFSPLADKERFLVIYPDGIYNGWNDGRGVAMMGTRPENDLGFVKAMLDYMQKNYRLDAQRIYATGVSNGGIFSNRLGIEFSDTLAAIGPVVGNLPIEVGTQKVFAPEAGKTRPLSVLMINGTEDPLVKWNGGAATARKGGLTSVGETVARWVQSDGCPATPNIENLPDKVPDDGTTVRRETYSPCRAGTEVVLYAVVGGGHGWPGGERKNPGPLQNLVGKQSREINSTQVIWEFFKRHPKAP